MARKGVLANSRGEVPQDVTQTAQVKPGWSLFSETMISRLKAELGLPPQASDTAVFARLGLKKA